MAAVCLEEPIFQSCMGLSTSGAATESGKDRTGLPTRLFQNLVELEQGGTTNIVIIKTSLVLLLMMAATVTTKPRSSELGEGMSTIFKEAHTQVKPTSGSCCPVDGWVLMLISIQRLLCSSFLDMSCFCLGAK